MSINLGGGSAAYNPAQQAAIAEQVSNQLDVNEDSTVNEGAEGAEGNGANATATKDAVKGKNSGSEGQEGGEQHSSQNSSETVDTKAVKGNNSTASAQQAQQTAVVAEVMLEKTAATETDVAGVHSAPIAKTQQEGEPLVINFAQPTLPAPTRFTSAELVIAMIKLGADSVEQSLAAQQNSIESTQISKLQDLQIKATLMQDYYKNSPPTKSGFKMIFEGIASLFKGNLQEAGELLKRGFESSGAQIASIVMTVVSIALAVVSFGGASALVVLSCAALVTSLLADPALMKDMVDLCTNGNSSDHAGFIKDFTKAMEGITMALQVITMVMTLGTSAASLVGKVSAKVAKVATKAGMKGLSLGASKTAGLAKEMGKNMSKIISKSIGKQADVTRKISGFTKVATVTAEAASTATGIGSSISTAVKTVKTSEHQAFQADVEHYNIYLDNHKIDGEKQDGLTEQIMDRYRAMIDTLMQAVASLNSAMVSSAKA